MSLLLVAHGSRDPWFARTLHRVRDGVRAELPGRRVELAFLDLDEPLVGAVLDELASDGEGRHRRAAAAGRRLPQSLRPAGSP